ncbi:MAG: transketolase [Solirubrobacteraceae bacterium]
MTTSTAADQLCIDTIRTLSMDAVQKANSGHPGMPLAMAPVAYLLYAEVMKHNPKDPQWPDRDRFVLSAGHGSMLLYSALHLAGYELSLDDIKNFRQWGSLTPGHPERDRVHVTPGVEVTTGPLGQGFANGVGMAIAERFLRERYGADVQDHHVYAIVSDGDLMEGIAAEASSLAGHLRLGRLIYLYDDNDISLDGPTSLSFTTEDVGKRFEAYGWEVLTVSDANDLDALRGAIRAAQGNDDSPTLIRVKSVIGYPSPNKSGTSKAHGSPLGEDEVRATKEAMGWDPDAQFLVPDGVYEAFDPSRGAETQSAWQERFAAWRGDNAEQAKEWDAAWGDPGRPLPGLRPALPAFDEAIASRGAGGKAMAAFADLVPTMLGGAADLSESTKTEFPGGHEARYGSDPGGRNIFFGVREHGMAGAVNGIAAHGGIVRPYGSTFLQFADYMRGSIRLSALTGLGVAWVFTHDSVGLGEDGPTHQPVEHLAALRAIPGLVVLRPGDGNETSAAWRVILEDLEGPACLILSRQDLAPIGSLDEAMEGVSKGAYVVRDEEDLKAIIVATGSEVGPSIEAAESVGGVRVVSMPSWELFAQQDDAYRASVLPDGVPKISVEAAVSMGWSRWVDQSIALDRFGASAPGPEVLERFGFSAEGIAQRVRELL